MGLMDHRKQWTFELRADPTACLDAFARAMRGKSAFSPRKANWYIARGANEIVATYLGRGGLVSAASVLSQRVADAEDSAKGSTVSMQITGRDESRGSTQCSMWLSSRGSVMGFTSDAGFLRSYMNGVESELRALDSSLRMAKQ